jgi:hypothetical protein
MSQSYFEFHPYPSVINGRVVEKCSSEKGSIRREVARNLEPLVAKHFFGVNLGASLVEYPRYGLSLSCRKKIDLISRVIEAKLHSNSLSLEEHGDLTTLSTRFQNILTHLFTLHSLSSLSRSDRKRAAETHVTKTDYLRLLRAHVGERLYEQLFAASYKCEMLHQALCFNALKDRRITLNEPSGQVCAEHFVHILVLKLIHSRLHKALGALNVTTEFVELNRVIQPDWQRILSEAHSVIESGEKLNYMMQNITSVFTAR